VEVKNNNVDRALSKFKRKIEEDGKLQLIRERTHFEKPSAKRRRQKMEGTLRAKKRQQMRDSPVRRK
jgi:small subunit ribosomal protein S21|tara:strand:- start:77 stop:277 length:201 start_codon:yes stop_codon:yes gene_type:complete